MYVSRFLPVLRLLLSYLSTVRWVSLLFFKQKNNRHQMKFDRPSNYHYIIHRLLYRRQSRVGQQRHCTFSLHGSTQFRSTWAELPYRRPDRSQPLNNGPIQIGCCGPCKTSLSVTRPFRTHYLRMMQRPVDQVMKRDEQYQNEFHFFLYFFIPSDIIYLNSIVF